MTTDQLAQYVATLDSPPPELEQSEQDAPAYLFGNQRVLSRCAPPDVAYSQRVDIQQMRDMFVEEAKKYLRTPSPDYMLLVPAPPGSGKTWAGTLFAHWVYEQTGRRVLYAGPRHNFFGDVQAAAIAQGKDPNIWLEWQPRRSDEEHPERHTCHWSDEINTWMGKGYDSQEFCKHVCGWKYIEDGCVYHAQKRRPEPLVYGQHAHLFLNHPMAEQFSCVIGDEIPLNSIVKLWTVSADKILLDIDPREPLAEIIAALSRYAGKDQRLSGKALIQALGGPEHVLGAIASFEMDPNAKLYTPHLRRGRGEDAEKAPVHYLPVLLPLLAREAETAKTADNYAERVWLDKEGLKLLTRRYVNEAYPRHVIWFDATGTAELYREMFKRPVRILDAQPEIAGKIYQVTDRANGKASLLSYDEEAKEHNPTGKVDQLQAQIYAIIDKHQTEKYAVGTFQNILEILGLPGVNFYGGRGTNAFDDVDVFIVAGTPMPPTYQIETLAKALWPEDMTPFDENLVVEDRPYNYIDPDDGQGWQYTVSTYANPKLRSLLYQLREAEIIQMAHRSRMLVRPEATVYLLTNIPIPQLPPTRLLSIADIMNAPTGVNVFTWSDVRAKLEKYAREQGPLTITTIMDLTGVAKNTALKYRDILTEQYGWGIAPPPPDSSPRRGRPSSYYLPPKISL